MMDFPRLRAVSNPSILMNRVRTLSTSRGCGQVATVILTLMAWIGFIGCTTSPSETITPPSSTQKALIGKTKQDLMVCATVQPEERKAGELTVLKYYKEASILEESFAASKSSVARIHHGCWATLGLKNDRVEGVQYDSVPSSCKHEDHCDEIFESCVESGPESNKTIQPKPISQ